MSKKGGSKKDLYQTIASLQEKLAIYRDQNTSLLNACRLALQQPHDKNCWTRQKNPGPCTCHITDLANAVAKTEIKVGG